MHWSYADLCAAPDEMVQKIIELINEQTARRGL